VELTTPRFSTAIGSNLYAEDRVEYFSVFLVAVISATVPANRNALQNIVQSLHATAKDHCPMTTGSFFKSHWDEEMSLLKQQSIDTHQLWVAFGRPLSGPIYRDRCRARAE